MIVVNDKEYSEDYIRYHLNKIKEAREYFSQHGGAKGIYWDNGLVCAYGAIRKTNNISYSLLGPGLIPPIQVEILEVSSKELFGKMLVDVNDEMGEQAVLDVFDLAIKKLEGFLE